MKDIQQLRGQLNGVETIKSVTGVFESIASLRLAQIRDRVLKAQGFFDELWNMYTQIRVDEDFHYGRQFSEEEIIDKELLVVVTSDGGLSGDIDNQLIDVLVSKLDRNRQDILVIGQHGAVELVQRKVNIVKYFKMPQTETVNPVPIIKYVERYKSATVYYQTYVSLGVQDVKSRNLITAVQETAKKAEKGEVVITESNYIFEPSTYAVINHLERSMMGITLSQLILESKLAHLAARYQAMTRAHNEAEGQTATLQRKFNQAKRSIEDERLREVRSSIRRIKS